MFSRLRTDSCDGKHGTRRISCEEKVLCGIRLCYDACRMCDEDKRDGICVAVPEFKVCDLGLAVEIQKAK